MGKKEEKALLTCKAIPNTGADFAKKIINTRTLQFLNTAVISKPWGVLDISSYFSPVTLVYLPHLQKQDNHTYNNIIYKLYNNYNLISRPQTVKIIDSLDKLGKKNTSINSYITSANHYAQSLQHHNLSYGNYYNTSNNNIFAKHWSFNPISAKPQQTYNVEHITNLPSVIHYQQNHFLNTSVLSHNKPSNMYVNTILGENHNYYNPGNFVMKYLQSVPQNNVAQQNMSILKNEQLVYQSDMAAIATIPTNTQTNYQTTSLVYHDKEDATQSIPDKNKLVEKNEQNITSSNNVSNERISKIITPQDIDMNSLFNDLYNRLESKLKIEKERRGIF